MVSEIFPVTASDQKTDIVPSISKRQLPVSSTIVWYTVHDWEIYSKKDIKLFTQPSVKSPDELLGLSRLGA